MEYNLMLIGVISSIAAAMIIYLARTKLRILVNFLFSGVYPRIEGKYKLESDETLSAEPDQETFLELKQLGPIISEELEKHIRITRSLTKTL